MNLSTSKTWGFYIAESIVLAIIAGGIHHVRHRNDVGYQVAWSRYLLFFAVNMALFTFLDWVTPSLAGNIRAGYGYMVGVALTGILES